MLFSGIPFLFYFLPVVLICYFLAPKFAKNGVLLVSSLVFYAWGEPKYVLLMLISILVGYFAGLFTERAKSKKVKRGIMILGTVICLSLLLYFKYADFFISNFNAATGMSVKLLGLVLPVGISFYTFQIISYMVDVYRGEVKAQKNIIALATYISLFAQLIAGPIVRYSDMEKQLTCRVHSYEKIIYGIKRFVVGLSKKILIANVIGELVVVFRGSIEPSVGFYWMYAVAVSLQIYFDFSGYSDMAIGLGYIFGFELMENFSYPYTSKSITEFWRRWHISLGRWFRDYVYIPLGGNRVSKIKWLRNIFVVWFLTGFWHGADWNFILWGLLFAVMLTLEKIGLLEFLKKHNVIGHIYVIFIVVLGFVIFSASDMKQITEDFGGMFGLRGLPLWTASTGYYFRSYFVIMALAVAGSTSLPYKCVCWIKEAVNKKESGKIIWSCIEVIALVVMFMLCVAFLVDGSFNPFLYFRF